MQTAEMVERPSGSTVWDGAPAPEEGPGLLAGLVPFWATMATRCREFLSGSLRFWEADVEDFCCWDVVVSSVVEGFWVVEEGEEEEGRDGSLLLPFCARRLLEVMNVRRGG